MRILLVTPLVPSCEATAGGAVVMHGVLQQLRRRHEVTLATLAATGTDDAALAALRADGVEVHATRIWRSGGVRGALRRARFGLAWLASRDPLRARAFRISAFQHALDRLCTRRFDLIQVEDLAMGGYRFPAGTPMLLTDHEVRADDLPLGEHARWRRYQQRVWSRFDRIQTFTSHDAGRLAALAPKLATRVRTNPFGVDVPDERFDETDAAMIVFVGGFRHPPNVDGARWLAGDILPRVRERVPGAHLVIVGADAPRAVRSLACDDVAVTGRVASVQPYEAGAAVVAAPLRRGGGMRLKVLQAMAQSKPVVATPLAVEGIAEPGEELPVVTASTTIEFATAIAALLASVQRRRDLGCRARAYVARHRSWSSYMDRLEDTYQDLGLPVSR